MRLFAASATLIAYVFAGYPAIMAVLARMRPRPVRRDPAHTPTVSVVIAALDEGDVIDGKLENVLALDYPERKLEVIVVADGSADDTAERARHHDRTRVLHDSVRRGKAAALSRGAAAAGGEILVFSDANNLLAPGTMRALVSTFADPTVGCTTGRKAIDDGAGRPLDAAEGLYWRYESAIRGWEATVGSVTGVNGELLALRREAFTSLPEGTVNDDFVLAMQAAVRGWRIAYAPDAVSLEPASGSTSDEAVRRSRMTAGRAQALRRLAPTLVRRDPMLAWQVLSHKTLRLAVPPALAGLLIGNVSMLRHRPAAAPLLLGQLAFYGAALAGWRDERRGRRNRALYLPYYFCRMNAATVRGLAQFATQPEERIARWQRVDRGEHAETGP